MTRLSICLALATVVVAGVSSRAHEGHSTPSAPPSPPAAEARELWGPKLTPDRICLTWTGDPSRSQAVTWRTSTVVGQGYAELSLAGSGPAFTAGALRVPASTKKLDTNLGPCHYHRVEWNHLRPATKYAYRVGDGVNWSEWFQFTTAGQADEPFEFVYFGDAQNDIKSLWSRVVREAQADAPRARFMLHAGDLVNNGGDDALWGEWFSAGGWLNGMIPTVAAAGNHEYVTGSDGKNGLTSHWAAQFGFPNNGPPGLETSVYYFDYHNARIVVLNSIEKVEEQAVWLDRVLHENPKPWSILSFHYPIFSAAPGRDNVDLRKHWKPLIDKHRVDLVLQGHDHTYARTGLAVPDNLASGENVVEHGTVYVVSVSGPKVYKVEPRPFQHRVASGAQLYQIVSVRGNELTYRAATADGKTYDAFRLVKRPGQVNELIDQIPDVPELRLPE